MTTAQPACCKWRRNRVGRAGRHRHRGERRDRALYGARSRRAPGCGSIMVGRDRRAHRGGSAHGRRERERTAGARHRARRFRQPRRGAQPCRGHCSRMHGRIDVLVNNAGLIAPQRANSADGYEMTVAVNHLAPFLLTNLLLDRLQGVGARRAIVTVASQAHRGAPLDPAAMTRPPGLDAALGLWPLEAVQHPVHPRPGAAAARAAGSSPPACIPALSRPDRRPRGQACLARLAAGQAVSDPPREGRGDVAVPRDGARPGAVPRRLCRRQPKSPSPTAAGARRSSRRNRSGRRAPGWSVFNDRTGAGDVTLDIKRDQRTTETASIWKCAER